MNRKKRNVEVEVRKQVERLDPKTNPTIFIGFSGGSDSLALLVALVRVIRDRHKLICLHADHGQSPQSAAWVGRCEKICESLSVQLISKKLEISAGSNLENEFREKRYRFFKEVIKEEGVLFLGHHLNDQVETMFMRLFQGRGIFPMSHESKRDGLMIFRPFIQLEKEMLRQYLVNAEFEFIEDPSNQDLSYDRNYIRNVLSPAIEGRWPKFINSVAGVMTRLDNQAVLLRHVFQEFGNEISVSALPKQSRLKQVWLRSYIESRGGFKATWSALREFVRQIEEAGSGEFKISEQMELRLWRGTIYFEGNIGQYEKKIPQLVLDCREELSLRLPTGKLKLSSNKSSDALAFECPPSLSLLPSSEVRSLKYLGKEKSLKTLLSEKNVPPWRRKNWPVLSYEESPIIIPNVAVHDDHWIDMTKREGPSIRYLSFLRPKEPSS